MTNTPTDNQDNSVDDILIGIASKANVNGIRNKPLREYLKSDDWEQSRAQLKQSLLSKAQEYEIVTHDFGTPQVIAKEKAIPISEIEKMFGEGE